MYLYFNLNHVQNIIIYLADRQVGTAPVCDVGTFVNLLCLRSCV